MINREQNPTELLKHLRAIHFSIVVASFLTVLAILSGPLGEVRTAGDQLDRIAKIRNGWETWTKRFALEQVNWLKSLGIKWLDEEPEPLFIETQEFKARGLVPASESSIWRLRLDGLPIFFYLSIPQRSEASGKLILAMPSGRLNASDTLPLDISFPGTGGSPSFDTIKQFRDFWESARQPMAWFASELAPEAYLFIGADVAAAVPIKMNPGVGNALDLRNSALLKLRNSALDGCRDENVRAAFRKVADQSHTAFFCRDIHAGSLIIPMQYREPRIPDDLQQWLIKSFNLPGPGGTFSDSFPELDRVTRGYQELELEKARGILKAELGRSGERVEFLGMNIPETVMATWGGIVILMLQLYFWLHLRALCNAGYPSKDIVNEVAWIGTYSDFFARLTAFATIFVLPLGATVSAVMVADVSAVLAVALPFLVGAVAVLSALLVWSLSERSSAWSDEDANYREPQRLSSSEERDTRVEPRSGN